MTTTPIYLIVAATNEGISYNLKAFFSKSKAYECAAQLNIDQPNYAYTIQTLTLIGD